MRGEIVVVWRLFCGGLKTCQLFELFFRVFYLDCFMLLISNVLFRLWGLMLYNRIAVLRSERALSRQALAHEVGVNPQTIGFLERGDYTPSLELAFKISRFFRLPVEAVFSPDPFRPLSEQVYEMQKREA
jgi:DNA-binding XRE family transcriptional regulator